jgi:autotransporter-associated beta strand protein
MKTMKQLVAGVALSCIWPVGRACRMMPCWVVPLLMAGLFACSLPPSVSAAPLWWDASSTTGLQAGNGGWNLTLDERHWCSRLIGNTNNYSRVSWGSNTVTLALNPQDAHTNFNGSDAVFLTSGTSDVVVSNNAGNVQVNSMTFAGSGYTVDGAMLTMIGPSITNTFDATINAPLAGTVGLTKTGTATLTLGGTNTYGGATTVNAGTLLVNGSIAVGSAVTVTSGATLGGTGIVNGTVTVNANGTLDPGLIASVGTLLISNNVTFNSGATNNVDISGANNDVIDLGSNATLTITSGAILDIGTLVSGNSYVIARNISGTISGTFKDTSGNVLNNGAQLPLQPGWYIHYVSSSPIGYIVINQTSTAVVLLQLQAVTLNGQVTVRWSTSSEAQTAGFDLYRLTDGQWTKLNTALIPAQGWPKGGIGASYSVADPGAQAGATYSYKLVERTTTGQSITYGPFDRTVTAFVMTPLEVTAAGVKVHWLSRAGEQYRVLKCTDLASGQYLPIAQNVAATPPENEYLDPVVSGAGFYRIELQP